MNLNYLLLITALFTKEVSMSQHKIIVADVNTKSHIPYVSIKQGEKILYTDKNGLFTLKNENLKSLELASLSYENLLINTASINDTIFLKPKTEVLDNVIITSTKNKTEKTLGKIRRKFGWHINQNTQLSVLLKPNKEFINSTINKIKLPINKKTLKNLQGKPKRIKPDFRSSFKVHLYSNYKGKPKANLIEKPILIEVNQDSEDIVTINLTNKIAFSEEGLFLIIEMIGELDNKNHIISKSNHLPGFFLTKKQLKGIKKAKSFYRGNFDNKWYEIKPEIFNSTRPLNLSVEIDVVY